jgi:phosphoglycerate dehydrogenase-like enzyme
MTSTADPGGECIVVLDDFPPYFGGEAHPQLRRLRRFGTLTVHGDPPTSRAEMFERLAPATALINVRIGSILDAEALSKAPRLRVISFVGVGPTNIDLLAARGRSITVCSLPGENAIAVAEFALGLMLSAMRHITRCDRELRAGMWTKYEGLELYGRTLGVVGLGAIGAQLVRLGHGIGMTVVAWSFTHDAKRAEELSVQLVERDDLFAMSDVVCLCVRGSAESRHFVGAREIELMKPTAVLVNTARGSVVDEHALLDALTMRRIAGAALDVFDAEPLEVTTSPLRNMDNVVLTPHTAGETHEANDRMRARAVENLVAFLEGRPTNVVN